MPPEELGPDSLYHRCDPEQWDFATTADLRPLVKPLGQPRAVEAVQFGIGIQKEGYNIFALGPPGLGKHTLVRTLLEEHASEEADPSDWCYVNDFENPQKPRAMRLPAGVGRQLCVDMERLVEELQEALPAAFESDEYRMRLQLIQNEVEEQQQKFFETLHAKARKARVGMLRTPVGVAFAPVDKEGNVMASEAFEKLPPEKKKEIQEAIESLNKESQAFVQQVPRMEKEVRSKIRELRREVADLVVGHLVDELKKTYDSYPEVVSYLAGVQEDVTENLKVFLPQDEIGAPGGGPLVQPQLPSSGLNRYQVNLLVDHGDSRGTPVIFEDNPTYQNLVGRVEHMAEMGTLLTDFTLIRGGALHLANEGYLVLDARKVLTQPYAWDGLKRALKSRLVHIESLGQVFSIISTVSLEPEPIPLDVKVILVGDRTLYYLLSALDPDFGGLFKVAADFEDQLDRNPDNQQLYARVIAAMAEQEGTRPLDRGAVARVIEHGSRLAADSEKLSIHLQSMVDLLDEADYWAGKNGNGVITADDVERSIRAQTHRSDRVKERLQEEVLRGTILIDTQGEKVGQLNGLSVLSLGGFSFGRPSRISARVRLGKGEVLNIEREVELSGPIHSKGVLILSSFLGARYAADRPLSLQASLVFEQSYGGVDGDSASSAELYTLLSAIAEVPLKQSLAVTGSVNQHGQVQAIGGVNEKIEGYFEVCQARGLTGDQGVLIPASNVKHLMLKREVVDSVAQGKFHIFPVESIDEGIELLTGIPAGAADGEGKYPDGSINHLVQARLAFMAETMLRLSRKAKESAGDGH